MAQNLTKAILNGKLLFPSRYIAAIEFKGRDVTLTIAGIKMDELKRSGGGKEVKPVLSFKETRKILVLNKTNASSIAEMYGAAAEKWIGCKVTLYPTRTTCGRETVDCVRIRDTRPKGNEPAPQLEEIEPEDDDLLASLPSDDALPSPENPQPPAVEQTQPAPAPQSLPPGDQAAVASPAEAMSHWEQLTIQLSELASERGADAEAVKRAAVRCLPRAYSRLHHNAPADECAKILQAAKDGVGFFAMLAPTEAGAK